MSTVGERLPAMLESAGFETVFGIPGVHTVGLYRGLASTGLRHVTPRHEQGAGFMADGYARASGRPAVCLVISGPGVTNIATAVAQAYADSVPMLVISSVLPRAALGRAEGRLHELRDQSALMGQLAHSSHRVLTPDGLVDALGAALTVFRSQRPRPVHIELPLDVIRATAATPDSMPSVPPVRPAPDPRSIDDAAARLIAATSPLVILGGGTVGAAAAARRLVERIGAPVLLTINAKGVLPAGHPLLVGSMLPQPAVREALRQADTVLAIGTELGETDTLAFDVPFRIGRGLIRIDIDPPQLSRTVPADLALIADAGLACDALRARLESSGAGTRARARAPALRQRALDDVAMPYRQHGRLLDALVDAVPELVVVGDSTQPVYGGNLCFDARAPRRWFNSATGFGTLGYALPAAIGARLGCPDAPVAALIGDGGLQFTIAELATGVELRLPLPVLCWNNRGYREIRRYMEADGIEPIGVDIHTPDFGRLAQGFGARNATPSTLAELVDALERALETDRPTLIDIDEHLAMSWNP